MNRLCLLLLPLVIAGCASGADPDDRRFFNRGWLNPHKDIDLDPAFDPPQNQMPREVHPEKYKQDPIVDG